MVSMAQLWHPYSFMVDLLYMDCGHPVRMPYNWIVKTKSQYGRRSDENPKFLIDFSYKTPLPEETGKITKYLLSI